jgi:transcription antitermination factor NusG
MSNDPDVKDIIAQLQRLQIQQSTLLTRLGQLSQSGQRTDPPPNATRDATPNAAREFEVGDRVRIRNPGVFQPTKGTIIKIGASRITVQARNGTKIVRAPKNLIHEDE